MFSPGPTQYIIHTTVAQYSLFVLKLWLNTDQPTNQPFLPLSGTGDVKVLKSKTFLQGPWVWWWQMEL